MRRPRCVSVAATLSARGEAGLSPRMLDHVDGCMVCRSELVGHRSLERDLADLRTSEMRAPADLYPRVMADVGPWAVPDPPPASLRMRIAAAAAVATAATATAAAGTAVIVLRARQRAA